MANINLLPWRDELRQERKKEFINILVLAVALAAMSMMGVRTVYQNKVDVQKERNDILTTEIALLDKKIKEIKELEQQKQELINRMEIIQDLQQSRPLIVRLFDELVRIVPDGVFLDTLERKGQNLSITGKTESNPRVASFMRNVENSLWIQNASLKNITQEGNRRGQANSASDLSEFKMSAQIVKGPKTGAGAN
ncbi:MAG: PilN domain-containing protein [Pseudomonadota bacterium]